MAPITNPERYHDSIDFWQDVYGIKSKLSFVNPGLFLICLFYVSTDFFFFFGHFDWVMYVLSVSSMKSLAKQCAFIEPSVETITGESVLTWPCVVSVYFVREIFKQEFAIFSGVN